MRWAALGLLLAVACVRAAKPTGPAAPTRTGELRSGLASFYGEGFDGKLTASGEKFDRRALTAAHRTLPFGACVRVEVADTGKSVKVRVNDRGPFVGGRVIDVSEGAARELGIISRGVVPVKLERCD